MLEELLSQMPGRSFQRRSSGPESFATVLLVSGYSGFGLHAWLTIIREFPEMYRNFVFV